MTCSRCGNRFDQEEPRCPHCGAAKGDASGLFQTSTVLISSGGADLVYRSVEEIPPGLRTRLLKSTSGGNSGIILIADRRGRHRIPARRRTWTPERMVRRLGLIYRKDKALSKAALGFIQVVLDHVGEEATAGR